jgi:hypothetical protein
LWDVYFLMPLTFGRQARGLLCGVAVLVCFPLLAHEGEAARIEFVAEVDGNPVAGGDVCFYRGGGDFFSSEFFSVPESRCYPTGAVLRVPSGTWEYYLNHPDGYTTSHQNALIVPDHPPHEVHVVSRPLGTAATLDLSRLLVDSETTTSLWIYFSNEGVADALPIVRPVSRARMMVPANQRIAIIMVRDGVPLRSSDPLVLRPGELHRVDGWSHPEFSHVIAGVRMNPKAPLDDRISSTGLPPPEIRLVGPSGAVHHPVIKLRPSPLFDRSLVIFRNVSPGAHEITLSGYGWTEDRLAVRLEQNAAPSGIVRPLQTLPSRNIVADWRIDELLLSPRWSRCEEESMADQEGAQISMLLRKCPDESDWRGHKSQCRVIEQETIDLNPAKAGGLQRWELLEKGRYYVEIAHETAAALGEVLVEAGFGTTAVDLQVEAQTIHGRVFRGEVPVRAVLHFRGGKTVSAEGTGEYRIAVSRIPHWVPIRVEPCDGSRSFAYVPAEPIRPHEPLDIRIPTNHLAVAVIDESTGGGVAGAGGNVAVLGTERGDIELARRELPSTDSRGETSITTLQPEIQHRICIHHPSYHWECRDEIRLGASEEARLEIPVRPKDTIRGRVASATVIRDGGLTLVQDDRLVDSVKIAEDGQFLIRSPEPGAALIFTSSSHPLFVFENPVPDATEHLVLQPPVARIRSFTVRLAPSSHHGGQFSVQVGATIIPGEVLSRHQLLRRAGAAVVYAGRTADIVDVAETGDIFVILWPPNPSSYLVQGERGVPMAVRAAPRFALGQNDEVVLHR